MVNVLYRFLNAFNKPRLTKRIKSKMPRIIIPISTEVGVSVVVVEVVVDMVVVVLSVVVMVGLMIGTSVIGNFGV